MITVWSVVKDSGEIVHNHIEEGWVDGTYPKPLKFEFTNQRAWKNMKWNKEHAMLLGGVVVQLRRRRK